jgi:hypothetical protein
MASNVDVFEETPQNLNYILGVGIALLSGL